MDYKKIYEDWLANPYFDEATKAELLSIKDDENESKELFLYGSRIWYRRTFAGCIGAGINRMNKYVVRKTTQGLANYIKKQGGEAKGVAIAMIHAGTGPLSFLRKLRCAWQPMALRHTALNP